jgi:hypothetical protein
VVVNFPEECASSLFHTNRDTTRVVHDVKNISFSFLTHVGSFDKNKRKTFVDAVVFSIRTTSKDQLKSKWAQSVLDTPKQSIWLAGLLLLSNIRINIDILHYQRDLREHLTRAMTDNRLYVVYAPLKPLELRIRHQLQRYAFARALETTRIEIVPQSKQSTVRGGAALVQYETERRRAGTRG